MKCNMNFRGERMSNKIKISKDNIARFMLDELLLYESYKNIKLNADKSAENIANEFNEFINRNNKNNNDAYEAMYHYAKSDVEYMLSLSTITNMYNTFEQFLKKMLNIKFNSHKSLNRLCNDFLEKYEYKYEENN